VQLLLQILSDDFWVPQEELLVLPERRGECHGLDVYCLGLGVAKLQDKAHETRTLLLQTLVSPLASQACGKESGPSWGGRRWPRGALDGREAATV